MEIGEESEVGDGTGAGEQRERFYDEVEMESVTIIIPLDRLLV